MDFPGEEEDDLSPSTLTGRVNIVLEVGRDGHGGARGVALLMRGVTIPVIKCGRLDTFVLFANLVFVIITFPCVSEQPGGGAVEF